MIDQDALQGELVEIRAVLFERIANIQSQLAGSHSADLQEQRQEREDDDVLHAVLVETKTELNQLNHALQRIYDGVYGECEGCGQPVGVERHAALPYATRCIKCAGM